MGGSSKTPRNGHHQPPTSPPPRPTASLRTTETYHQQCRSPAHHGYSSSPALAPGPWCGTPTAPASNPTPPERPRATFRRRRQPSHRRRRRARPWWPMLLRRDARRRLEFRWITAQSALEQSMAYEAHQADGEVYTAHIRPSLSRPSAVDLTIPSLRT